MAVDIGDLSFFNKLQLVKEGWEDWEWDDIDWWKPLARGVNIIDGEIGSGKTTYLVLSSYKIRKYFNQPVICDAPDLFKPAFGQVKFLDWMALIENLGIMAKQKKVSKYMIMSHHLEDLYKSVGVDPNFKTILIDEAHKVLNQRRGAADVVLLIGQTLRQVRHFGSLVQISSQEAIRNLDKHEGVDFHTGKIICNYDEADKISYYAIQSKFLPKGPDGQKVVYTMTINPDNWKELYNSFSPVQKTARELVKIGGSSDEF